ncbi:MAG: TIGR00645 family protein [Bacteroidota bacterium]
MMKILEKIVERLIYHSRWIQVPMYLGLIVVAILYSVRFLIELWHLCTSFTALTESQFMLLVIGLIDASMVINLLIIIVIGGYWAFVSKIDVEDDKDFEQFSYLGKISPSTLKIKLVVSLISISGVHLLEVFLRAEDLPLQSVVLKIAIHLVFLISAVMLAYTDKLLGTKH